jgi:hypothetical protein
MFRQKFVLGLAHRAIAQSVGVSLGAVATALARARTVGLDWAQVQELGDDTLEQRLYGGRGGRRADRAPLPDPACCRARWLMFDRAGWMVPSAWADSRPQSPGGSEG